MTGAPVDLTQYATHLDDITTEGHETIVDINGINPLSELRETWQNVTHVQSERKLSTVADTNDKADLTTVQRGQYTAGFSCQAGIGVRVPSEPTGDSVMRWGYYSEDSNGDPLDGFYFGVDSTGIFVCRVDDGQKEKVYQKSWNRDKLDGQYSLNPSDRTVDISDGLVFRIDFTYYGYGPIEMKILLDDDDSDNYGASDLVTAHVFHVKGGASTNNTNLPIKSVIESNGNTNDALDLFVGGRQFSVVGNQTSNIRKASHYLDGPLSVDDTKWYAAITFKIKDGSDNIGSGRDYSHVLGRTEEFSVDTDANVYRWQVRRGTVPDNPNWKNPDSAEDKPDETAMKVDTQSADVQDGNGDLTGVHIDSGVLAEGQKNEANISDSDIDGQIPTGQPITLLFKAKPTTSGSISEIQFKVGERW